MVAQFKRFYREENAQIVEQKAGKDYYRLFVIFTTWLETTANAVSVTLSEKGRNIVIAKTLRDWDGWVTIVDRAAEEMVFETFHPAGYTPTSPTIPTPSPTGEGYEEGAE